MAELAVFLSVFQTKYISFSGHVPASLSCDLHLYKIQFVLFQVQNKRYFT
jgi:hypothetical protein